MYIIIEGIDGSGKSTLATNLHRKLGEFETKVFLTREPGSLASPITTHIRKILKNECGEQAAPLAELFLFMADRAHHYHTVVLPKLKDGWIVIQDRGFMSTVAYQGYGRGLDIGNIKWMNDMVMKERYPDIVLWVDTPLDIAYSRIEKREYNTNIDPFEIRQFQELVYRGFSSFCLQSVVPMLRLDGSKSQDELCHDAMMGLTKYAIGKTG